MWKNSMWVHWDKNYSRFKLTFIVNNSNYNHAFDVLKFKGGFGWPICIHCASFKSWLSGYSCGFSHIIHIQGRYLFNAVNPNYCFWSLHSFIRILIVKLKFPLYINKFIYLISRNFCGQLFVYILVYLLRGCLLRECDNSIWGPAGAAQKLAYRN